MPSSAWSSDVCSSDRSEEHTTELQSLTNLVCRLLLATENSTNNNDLQSCATGRSSDQSRVLHSRLASAWSSDVCSPDRSEEHTSELQSLTNLVCRLLLGVQTCALPIDRKSTRLTSSH